jgi:DNA-binding response OmpR family regulator
MARILVVDDSASAFFFVRRELTLDGHVVERLSAFTELPTYLSTNEPDLILLDLEMPALSGTAVGQFIRRMERRPIPILIHSSLPIAEAERAAAEVKAVGALPKTNDGARLRFCVRAALEKSSAESAQKAAEKLG